MKKFLNNKYIKLIFIIITFTILFTTIAPTTTYALNAFTDLANLDIVPSGTGKNEVVSISQLEGSSGNAVKQGAWNRLFTEYKGILVGISGVCSLTFFLLFMLNASKLASSASNPTQRAQIVTGLLWTGIGCGGFAAITLLMGMAFKIFQ